MKKKSLLFQNLLKIPVLVACLLGIVGFKLPENNPKMVEKPVYIVTNEGDYFRLITISTNQNDNIPILLLSNEKSTDKLDNFQKYYQGTSVYITPQEIDKLILKRYPDSSKVVVSDKSRESLLFASLISSTMQIPLFVDKIPSDVLSKKNLTSIIAVGDVKPATSIKNEKLDSFEKAQNYYNHLVDKTDTSVVISDPKVYSIGAEAAAYHQAQVFFNIEDGKSSKTGNLIWVTLPANLGQTNFRRLYAGDSENNVNGIYSQNIGVITGFTVEDMSFLLARTFAYHDMQGGWKNSFVVASVFSSLPSSIKNENGRTVQSYGAADLNFNSFNQAISSANYVFAYAHGSMSGLRFEDGSWPNKGLVFTIPPLLFVAEACSTMNFDEKETDQSIVLKTISSGAVAFVGSMEIGGVSIVGDLPYSNSTRQIPLGEMVKMQNSILVDFVADNARAVLVGDPTFFMKADKALANGLSSTENTSDSSFEIKNASPTSDIYVKLHSKKEIVRAIATLDDGRKIYYFRGGNFFAGPIGVVSNNSDQTILFTWPGGDGKIVFYDTWTFPMVLMHYFGDSLLGVKTLLLDIATISKNQWIYAGVILVLLLLSFKRLLVKRPRFLIYLLAGFLFSGLISLIYVEVSFAIRIPVTLALFMWSFLSLCFFDRNENATKKILYSLTIFLIPFLYGLFISLVIGVAGKTSLVVLEGVILLGVFFFAMQFLLQKILVKVKK